MISKLEQKLRLYSGLVIAFFLVLHLLNAGLGIVGLQLMDRFGEALFTLWSIPVFSIILYGSFVIHIVLLYVGLYRRRSLKMPWWNILQYALALLLPLLLIGHILGTRGAFQFFDIPTSYTRVVSAIWRNPSRVIQQYALVGIAWTHMAIGIHYWLRHRQEYTRLIPILYPLCLIIPLLAFAGFLSAGLESQKSPKAQPVPAEAAELLRRATAIPREVMTQIETAVLWSLALLLVVVLFLRIYRSFINKKRGGFLVSHTDSKKLVAGRKGQTVLDALRDAGIEHAAICGGRGRCTTCRIRVADCTIALPAPQPMETRALKRIAAEPNVRLACQLKPNQNVTITPLLPADATALAARQTAGVVGREQQVACMFVDMRDSTALGEQKLPYDVVFILNQFFIELDKALRTTNGHYATFNGDGLMALYGIHDSLEKACEDALKGALEIQQRLDKLNGWLQGELNTPLRVGIGIHCGDAIVGTMGPPDAPTVSAIGDTVNIAARLEALSKEYSTEMLVSEEVLHHASIPHSAMPKHTVQVRGREEPLNIVVIDSLRTLLHGEQNSEKPPAGFPEIQPP